MRQRLPALLLAMLVGGCGPSPPGIDLLIPVNAKCTTCEDFIRCDAGSTNPAVYDPAFDIYRLEPKGTLAQLATVWEFLIQLFYTRTEDHRPLSVYSQRQTSSGEVARSVTPGEQARTDLLQNRIFVPQGWIDQVTGARHGEDGQLLGVCRLLKPAEGREMLQLFAEAPGGGPG